MKNYMKNKRANNENKQIEYKKYNHNNIKKYLKNNNLLDIRKINIMNKIKKYRQNENKYGLEKLNNKERLRNLRQNPEYRKKDNFNRSRRIANQRKNNNEMREHDSLRIKYLRTKEYFQSNERLRNRIYKKK